MKGVHTTINYIYFLGRTQGREDSLLSENQNSIL